MLDPEVPVVRLSLRSLSLLTLAAWSTTAAAGAVASSFKKETRKGANYWNAQNLIDGKLDTCWMVPGESPNRGEYVILDVPKATIDKIGMVVGWAKDEDTFKDYARVKEVRIDVMQYNENNELVPAGSATASFEDKMDMQVVDIDDIAVGDDLFGGKVKISIVDIYEGRDFPNVAVSEVLLYLAEFDAAPQIKEISDEDPKHTRESMVDDNPRTFFAGSSADFSVTFEAPGFSLARVGLLPGPATYDRPKKVEVTANGRSTTVELADGKDTQWVEIPAVVGYTGSAWGKINLKVLDVYPGTTNAGTLGIGELDLKATAYEGI